MRTLTRRLAPHARTSWLTLGVVSLAAVALAVLLVLANGGGRYGVVAAVFTGVVLFAVLAAVLDAILVPGNPEVRQPRPGDGWTGAIWSGGFDGGGHAGGHGGGHGDSGASSG